MGASWMTCLVGPVYTLLPQRWRVGRLPGSDQLIARAAMISGIVESLLAFILLRSWYLRFFAILAEEYAQYATSTKPGSVISAEYATQAGFITFMTHPLTWLILLFCLEGAIRGVAGLATGEVYGTLPLYLIALAFHGVTRRRRDVESPLVRDEILPGDGTCDLRIASCRKRTGWKYPFTLRHEGSFFRVIAEKDTRAGVRPYVYSFRRLSPGEIARGLKDYDPEDILFAPQPLSRLV